MKTRIAPRTIAAVAVHLLTGSGAAVATLALAAAVERDFATMFALLGLALLIDGVDGPLARLVDVKTWAPWCNGDTLDLVVDYLTYVLVPLVALWRAGLLGEAPGLWIAAFAAAASTLYFGDRRMKMDDNWFRGFPALWNVVAIYLFTFTPPVAVNIVILAVLSALMFAPIGFVHPLRVKQLNGLTVVATVVWLISAALVVADDFAGGALPRVGLAATAAYFVGLSVWRWCAPPLPN